MEDDVVHIPPEDIEIIVASEYSKDWTEYFNNMPRCSTVTRKRSILKD